MHRWESAWLVVDLGHLPVLIEIIMAMLVLSSSSVRWGIHGALTNILIILCQLSYGTMTEGIGENTSPVISIPIGKQHSALC